MSPGRFGTSAGGGGPSGGRPLGREGRRSGDPTDEDLLARHLAGDPDAFCTLVERYERRVYGICLRILANVEDAQDAAQDAFVALLRRAASFAGQAAFSTWIYRVAVNSAIDQARRRGRAAAAPLGDRPDDRPAPAGAAPDPGEQVSTRVTVEAEIARLPEEFRAALVVCDLCRLPYAEAAEILQVAVGTVKSRVFRARAALAQALHGLDPRGGQEPGTARPPAASHQPTGTRPVRE